MKHPLCMARRHRWGPVEGDAGGALRRCLRCGKTKRLGGEERPAYPPIYPSGSAGS
jgi:hypothetical protein